MPAAETGEVAELLQHLIRNACVNDGTADSGGETRSADTLRAYLDGCGADFQTYSPVPGRNSLVARLEGTDPGAPSLVLMGHTDVVPVRPASWTHDPFGGELIDGEIWGRGAVDMLNLTSSMAVAFRSLAAEGFRPRGTLVYLAVADEEALGTYGAKWLLDNEPDAVLCDYLVTESGGVRVDGGAGPRVGINVAEKGTHWVRLVVEGTPGHASRPLRTDNALVKAAEAVTRIAAFRPQARVTDTWERYVRGMGFDGHVEAALLDPERIYDTCMELPLYLGRAAHACTHTTFAPTVLHGGTKTNVIPDRVELEVDIRTLPGDTHESVEAMLAEALGDLRSAVTVEATSSDLSTASPLDTPLWDSLTRVAKRLAPEATVVPGLMAGATDARFFRRRGVTAYGAGLFSAQVSADRFADMFHGNDERVDLESLRLTTELWLGLVRDLLG